MTALLNDIIFPDTITSLKINCEVRKYEKYPKVDSVSSFVKAIVVSVSYDSELDDLKYESIFAYNRSDLASLKSDKQPIHYLPENIYETYPKLASLIVTEAGLRRIRYEHLRQLEQLKVLDLQSNKIETLESNLFTDNSNLQDINLRNNKLHSISPTSFENLIQLREINFAKNECIDKAYYFETLHTKSELRRDLTETCPGYQNKLKILTDRKECNCVKQHEQVPLIEKTCDGGNFGKMEKYSLVIVAVCLYFIVDLSAY